MDDLDMSALFGIQLMDGQSGGWDEMGWGGFWMDGWGVMKWLGGRMGRCYRKEMKE